MRDIVAKCLVKDPAKRPTAAQLLEHKFFKVRLHIAYICSGQPLDYACGCQLSVVLGA